MFIIPMDIPYLEIFSKPKLAIVTTISGLGESSKNHPPLLSYINSIDHIESISTLSIKDSMVVNTYAINKDTSIDIFDCNQIVKFLPKDTLILSIKISKVTKYKPKHIIL